MFSSQIKKSLLLFVSMLMFISVSHAQKSSADQHIEVSLRMIGHQILLSSKDSTARVLPIVNENGRYKIQFESEFEFIPEELVATIDTVVKDTGIATSYLVEVAQCESGEIVYSFKMDAIEKSDIVPCQSRLQPKSCYYLLFTILNSELENALINDPTISTNESDSFWTQIKKYLSIAVLVLMFSMVTIFLWKRMRSNSKDPNLIPLGEYHFDKRNTELLIEEQRIELTSKEADLLLLLYDAANTTVERDVILNMVWGDEGDYVGRTLDVFISKLRKKLEFDSKVKIVNIRGVGYKLVVDI